MITSYDTLPVGKYEAIQAIIKEADSSDLAIVAVLAGKTEDELLNMPLTQYEQLRDAASFLYFEPKPHKVVKSYKVRGFELIPCTDERKLTTAQYIDFKELIKTEYTLAQILSVFLVPAGKQYNEGYDVLEVQDAISAELSILDAIALQSVFQTRLVELMLATLTSSAKIARMMQNRTKRRTARKIIRQARRSVRNGAGCDRLMLLRSLPVALGMRYIAAMQ